MQAVKTVDVSRDSLLGEVLALTGRIDRQVDNDQWDGVDELVRARQRAMERLFALVDDQHPLCCEERQRLREVFDSMQQNLELVSLARTEAAVQIRQHQTGQSAVVAYVGGGA